LGHLIPAGTGFRTFQDSDVRYRPEALAALEAAKDRAMLESFPLLEQAPPTAGPSAPPAASPAPAAAVPPPAPSSEPTNGADAPPPSSDASQPAVPSSLDELLNMNKEQ